MNYQYYRNITMKNVIKLIILCLALPFAFTACENQNEPTPKELQHPFVKTEEYLANLRAYKKTDHQVAFGWFGLWTAEGSAMSTRLNNVPDSMDIISIWGDWHNLSPAQIADKEYVQQVKGTKVIFTTFAHELPKEFLVEDEDGDLVATDEGILVYAKALVDSVNKYNYDGLDFDYEPGWGGKGHFIDPDNLESTSLSTAGRHNMEVLVREISKYLGPKSGTGKLFVIDGVPGALNMGLAELFDYGIVQSYNSSGDGDLQGRFNDAYAVGWKPEQYIFTENFESYASTGGNPDYRDNYGNTWPSLIGMARFHPTQGKKGGAGTYHMENEYVLSPDYKYMRQAIQIMNPANQ